MTSLPQLLTYFAIAGIILAFFTIRAKKHNNMLVTFLQHFAGVWFVWSGLVKAVDPIGTAYKMQDYFNAFQTTAEGTWAKSLAGIFPALASISTGFSIFMIVLEIALGVALLIGWQRRMTAWLFFLVSVFFTILTGYTFLTGYVPDDVNFFDFGKWGKYVATQMDVTDCGCFGDFIKLDPKISFLKDVALLMPISLIFLIGWRKMHQLIGPMARGVATWATVGLSTLLCFQNTFWDLPMVDFRPFKVGTNVREQKEKEAEAESKRPLTYILTNKTDGKVVEMPVDEFMKRFKEFPKTDWNFDTRKGETSIPITKISDFHINIPNGGEVSEDILNEKGWQLMIVAYDLKNEGVASKTISVQDTIWQNDTAWTKSLPPQFVSAMRSIKEIVPKSVTIESKKWSENYRQIFQNTINPFAEAAEKAGWKVFACTSPNDPATVEDFRHFAQTAFPFYEADDKLLKTITRANPGVVVWHDGVVKAMWHWRKLPDFESAKSLIK